MGSLSQTLAIVGTLLAFIATAAALSVVFVLQRRDQVQRKQREWIEDLTGRLDYVEPKLKQVITENKTLRSLMNPTAQLERNQTEIMSVLNRQNEMLSQIQTKVEERHG